MVEAWHQQLMEKLKEIELEIERLIKAGTSLGLKEKLIVILQKNKEAFAIASDMRGINPYFSHKFALNICLLSLLSKNDGNFFMIRATIRMKLSCCWRPTYLRNLVSCKVVQCGHGTKGLGKTKNVNELHKYKLSLPQGLVSTPKH